MSLMLFNIIQAEHVSARFSEFVKAEVLSAEMKGNVHQMFVAASARPPEEEARCSDEAGASLTFDHTSMRTPFGVAMTPNSTLLGSSDWPVSRRQRVSMGFVGCGTDDSPFAFAALSFRSIVMLLADLFRPAVTPPVQLWPVVMRASAPNLKRGQSIDTSVTKAARTVVEEVAKCTGVPAAAISEAALADAFTTCAGAGLDMRNISDIYFGSLSKPGRNADGGATAVQAASEMVGVTMTRGGEKANKPNACSRNGPGPFYSPWAGASSGGYQIPGTQDIAQAAAEYSPPTLISREIFILEGISINFVSLR